VTRIRPRSKGSTSAHRSAIASPSLRPHPTESIAGCESGWQVPFYAEESAGAGR